MQKLIIIRGLPGSGKSTLAREYAEKQGFSHFEADQYFMKDGVYTYVREDIGKAHAFCQSSAFRALDMGFSVVVANTFCTKREFRPYLDYADSHKIPYEIIVCRGNFGSIHAVPDEIIEKMREKWQD
jgi:predicted kinase